ncbi:MAG: PAS domain S-box protein [Thermoanaerobaculia bacterium]
MRTEANDLVRALAASEDRLFQLLEQVPVGVIALAVDGTASYANRAAREILGRDLDASTPLQEMPQKLNIFVAGTSQFYPYEKLAIVRALQGESARVTDVEIRRPGRTSRLDVSSAPLYGSDGKILLAFATLNDITESVRVAEELRESQRAYRDLFENAPIGIYRTTPAGRVLLANPTLLQMLGYESIGELQTVDLSGAEVHADYDRDEFKDRLERSGEIRDLHSSWRRRDGRIIHVRENAKAMRDEAGTTLSYEGTVEDVTARVETEKELRSSREEYRHLVESATDIMYSCDPYGSLTYINPTVRKVLGYSEEELLGKHFLNSIDPGYHDAAMAFYRAQFDSRAPNTYYEIPVIAKNGERVWLGQNVQTLVEDQWVIGFQAVARDISGRKKMEEELAQARDAAVESARVKSEFLANVSHEIRTPMNGVIGMADLLVSSAMTAEQRDYAQTIRHSAESLLGIVDDILDLSKIEAGKLVIHEMEFDLDDLVDQITDVFAERAVAKGLRFRGIIYPDVHRQVRGDAPRIRQVLVNLIGNAIKFTAAGDVTLSVMQDADSPDAVTLWFLVNDTGIGISPDDQERLFTPFVQVDGTTTRRFGGTGLGLAISKQLALLLGGRIGVASVAGEGSTFWFTAPVAKDHRQAAPPKRAALVGLRALLVDGDEMNRLMVRRHLTSCGMEVSEASGEDEALEALRTAALSQPFDLAVVEMQLPRSDGLALTRAIRAEDYDVIARTPVVLLTVIGRRKSDSDSFRASGVSTFVMKPVRQSQLATAIASVIDQKPLVAKSAEVMERNAASVAASRRPRILVVEDNVVNQKVALGQLRHLGYDADVVGSGTEAIRVARDGSYDLILLDCQMPDIDGYDVAQAIRGIESGERRMPIVAMTAHAMEGERERCIAAGMDDYLAKPVSTSRLAETMSRWVKPPNLMDETLDEIKLAGLQQIASSNPQFMTNITSLFREDGLVRMHDLQDALDSGNVEELGRAAHALKSSSGNVGAKRIYSICATIEENALRGSLEGAAELIGQLAAELDVAVAALHRSAAGGKT